MKLLLISPNYPYPADKGDRIRTNAIITLFEELGFSIDLICIDRRVGEYPKSLKLNSQKTYKLTPVNQLFNLFKNLLLGKSVTSAYAYQAEMVRDIESSLSRDRYDLVVVISSAFDYLIPVLAKYQVNVYWDLIDFDSLKWGEFSRQAPDYKKWIYRREAKAIRQAEKNIIKYADKVSLISQRELRRFSFDDQNVENLFVLPQVINCSITEQVINKKQQIIFTGQMNYFPNIQAVKFFDSQVMPLVLHNNPNILFTVAGRCPSDSLIKSCAHSIFTGEVPEVQSLMAESKIAVVPLKSVFGVPNKVLEAMSAGIPVIVTPEVAKTIGAIDGKELLIADSAEEFSAQIDSLLNNPELSARLVQNAQSFLQHNFSLKVVASKLKAELDNII